MRGIDSPSSAIGPGPTVYLPTPGSRRPGFAADELQHVEPRRQMKCKSICPGGKLIRGKLSRTILAASCGLGLAFCTASVRLEAVPAHSTGTTRTYYVAADEVQWDYTPSGRDEAMGMDFDEIGKEMCIRDSTSSQTSLQFRNRASRRLQRPANCCSELCRW